MAGGAETPNIAALPAIARLGAWLNRRGVPDADRHVEAIDPICGGGVTLGRLFTADQRIVRQMDLLVGDF